MDNTSYYTPIIPGMQMYHLLCKGIPYTMVITGKAGIVLAQKPYDRKKALAYAHQWAYAYNSLYYNFAEIGGDCTNFASQCLYAGSGVMNYTHLFGWYYRSLNDRAPAWTGVAPFFQFLTRNESSVGPYGHQTTIDRLEPGDFIQLKFSTADYGHTLIVTQIGFPTIPSNILIAAHSDNADNRPLSSYYYQGYRPIHIEGVRY